MTADGTFEDIDDLFARMRVLDERRPGARLTRAWMTSRPGMLRSCRLEIGAADSRLLRPNHVQRQTASDDQHRNRHHSRRFQVTSW
jgi:hypothetical protein